MPVLIGPDLTFADVIAVARHDEPVEVSEQALTCLLYTSPSPRD